MFFVKSRKANLMDKQSLGKSDLSTIKNLFGKLSFEKRTPRTYAQAIFTEWKEFSAFQTLKREIRDRERVCISYLPYFLLTFGLVEETCFGDKVKDP